MIGPVDPERVFCAACGCAWTAGHVCSSSGVRAGGLLGRLERAEAALAAAEADRDRAKADAREAWSVEAQAADLLRDVRRDLARAEAERDALAKQLDEALSANHDGGYAIIGLQAERDALRMAGEAWRTALPADLVMAAASRLRQLQEAEEASSGSGGPGVHLTADEAETEGE